MDRLKRLILWIKRAWRYAKAHPFWSAVIATIAIGYGLWGFFASISPWEGVSLLGQKVWPMLTPQGIAAVIAFLVWVTFAAVLVGYANKQRQIAQRLRTQLQAVKDSRKASVSDCSSFQAQLKTTVVERDALQKQTRGHQSQIAQWRDAYGQSQKALANSRFTAFVLMTEREGWGDPGVTIRFIDYEDTKYVDVIEGIFRDYAPKWSVKKLRDDGSELRQKGRCRIVFESKNTQLASSLAGIFTTGSYLGEDAEYSASETLPLMVTVFPRVPRVASQPYVWQPDSADASSGGTPDTDGKKSE